MVAILVLIDCFTAGFEISPFLREDKAQAS